MAELLVPIPEKLVRDLCNFLFLDPSKWHGRRNRGPAWSPDHAQARAETMHDRARRLELLDELGNAFERGRKMTWVEAEAIDSPARTAEWEATNG